MEEEGSWSTLGLFLLPGVAVGWLVLYLPVFLLYHMAWPRIACLCRRGFLGGFIDQPTQGYNGNMPSWWVRIVGVRGTGLGPAWGLVVRRVTLGAGPACLGGLCVVLSIIRAWPSRVVYSALRQTAACCRQR